MTYHEIIDVAVFGEGEATTYHAFVWRNGTIEAYCACSFRELPELAVFCRRYGLPVIATSQRVQHDLRLYGIEALLPRERAVGDQAH